MLNVGLHPEQFEDGTQMICGYLHIQAFQSAVAHVYRWAYAYRVQKAAGERVCLGDLSLAARCSSNRGERTTLCLEGTSVIE